MEAHLPPLLIVLMAGVLAPVLGEFTSRFGLPVIVLEILLGVLIGPHGLGWVDPGAGIIPQLSLFGMAFLFFLAGMEIDLSALRERFARVLLSWLAILGFAYVCAEFLREQHISHAMLVITIAISTTALGILVPVLRDRDMLDTPLGQYAMALGAMGEVGPILAMSLTLSTQHSAPVQTAFTLGFIVVVILAGWALVRSHTPKVLRVLEKTLTKSSQLPIRIGVLLLTGAAILAADMGLDVAIGGLAAGLVISLTLRNSDEHVFHLKMDAIGFGFLIPIFFISSGMKLEIGPLLDNPDGWILTAVVVLAILLSRLPVMVLYFPVLGFRKAVALGLLSATTLSLIVALAEVGVSSGMLTETQAAPLVVAGMLTVMIFPGLAALVAGAPTPQRRSRDWRERL
jgi:Kef-type K+ transport system membrane component KefB